MDAQPTLIDTVPAPSKPTTRLVGGYQPALTPPTWSYATRIQPDALEGSNIPVYRLFFPQQLTADGTLTGAGKWWDFPRNLTLLQEAVDRDFPNGFQGKYHADICWRVCWRKSGNQLIVKEILPVEGPMQAPTELDEHLNANVEQADKPKHWIDNKATRAEFWATVFPWIKWAGHEGKPEDFAHDKIGKLHDWTDGQPAATNRLIKEAILERWRVAGREMVEGSFKDATGYSTLKAAWDSGLTDNEVRSLIDAHLAKPAEPPAPEAPENGASAALPPPPAIPIAKTVERAVSTPPSPENGQSEPQAKPSAIIPYQPKAVAHTLNVDWKITPLQMAEFAVQSGLYAGINSPAKAMVVMMRGLELGVSPLTALEQVNIIQGKTVVSSALFLALIERSGQLENMTIDDSKPDVCTITLTRRGRSPITATFTMDDARQMGLAGKDNWRKMPKTMLYHRALGIAGRRAFSDILLFGGGIYMPEELSPDTVVDENGEVIAA